jgi:hypothetical protein
MTRVGAWHARVMTDVARRGYPTATRSDLDAALRVLQPGILDFTRGLAVEAGVAPAIVDARCIAIAYSAAAVNLADDLADGDCDYLAEPYRSGPTTQYLLQSLFFQKLCELGIPLETLFAVTRDFEQVAALQHVELETGAWQLDVSWRVAEGITGRQLTAYLRIALLGDALAKRAEEIGLDVGTATHVAVDAETRDPRFTSLPETERRQLAARALEAADRACRLDLAAIGAAATHVRNVLIPLASAP